MKKTLTRLLFILSLWGIREIRCDSCYPSSIFVPRQLSYNPIFENALTYDAKKRESSSYIFSFKPLYTQSVGSKFKKYFTIGEKCSLNVQEDNSGDVNPLWFKVIASDTTFYSSTLSFSPKKQTYGSMIYGAANVSHNVELSINTALVGARNDMHLCEKNRQNLGTSDYKTVTQSFAAAERCFGKICGKQTKVGLDDIQVKVSYSFGKTCSDCNQAYSQESIKESSNSVSEKCRFTGDIYGLLGVPTGRGSKAKYLFEPLVGSKHLQLGFGADSLWHIKEYDSGSWSLLGEVKYRYAFSAQECRSFDLKNNGQWSRYMLFVNESDTYATYPAINDLTFKAKVTPGSSFDLYLATHAQHNNWNFEIGYDFWYRTSEKIKLCCKNFPVVGVADLLGIAAQDPHSASTATISQGVQPNENQMTSDVTFVPATLRDSNCLSGAQHKALSNTLYGSIGHMFETKHAHNLELGLNVSYEFGSSVNTPDNFTTWLNCDFYF